jgi:tight adherence protein C
MNWMMLLLAVPVFWATYNGMGLFLDSRAGVSVLGKRRRESTHKLRELTGWGAKLGLNRTLLQSEKFRARLDLLLVRSGHPFGWKVEDLLFVKEVGAIMAVLLAWFYGVSQPLLLGAALLLGFWLPSHCVRIRAAARQTQISRLLPGFIDLWALTLESGLDLLTAAERILDKMKPSALREEIQILLQETRLGTSRKEALQHWAFRVPLPDVQSLTSMIIQSEELGTSLASVLRNFADDLRNKRILRAEEVAGKAPVKLLFPMVVFFFPIIFVLNFGPLALNFFTSYK